MQITLYPFFNRLSHKCDPIKPAPPETKQVLTCFSLGLLIFIMILSHCMRFVLIFIPIIIAALGQLILKIGMNKIGQFSLLKTFTHPTVLLGLVFYGVSLILWLLVLSKEKLSFVYPLVAFSYVVTVFLSKVVLKETVPPLRWTGLIVIIIGILIVAKSS